MILNPEDAQYAALEFINYYNQFETIVDYQRFVRMQRTSVNKQSSSGCLFPPEDDLFAEWTMSPEDMEFELHEVGENLAYKSKDFHTYLDLIYSHANEKNIPGKRLQFIVIEKNTKKIVGLIHLASPIISIKPRHDAIGGVPDMTSVNRHAIMGNIIVPAQPFGFNYNGGKLIAAICCSHEIRERVMDKYSDKDPEIVCFETTSLYGSTKGMSMYDGMKPILRHYGDTESKILPNINDKSFTNLDHWFAERNNGEPLVPLITPRPNNPNSPTTSRKLRCQTKMRAIIKKSLKFHGMKDLLKSFDEAVEHGLELTERKRYYMCNYGYTNIGDVLLRGAEPIKNPESWDKFYLENLIEWWKKKATNRWNKLNEEGRMRTELEVWTSGKEIDIIR
jgi:hypothetical protein